jgi:hypothetical protein
VPTAGGRQERAHVGSSVATMPVCGARAMAGAVPTIGLFWQDFPALFPVPTADPRGGAPLDGIHHDRRGVIKAII